MTELLRNEWTPAEVSHPGETLLETLEVTGMTQAELALRMGRPKKTINELVKGKAAVSEETALQLEHVLGVPASFWLARQRDYDEARARRDEDGRLRADAGWLKEIGHPLLVKRGWLPRRTSVEASMRDALAFFQCGTVKGFREHHSSTALHRQSRAFEIDPLAVRTWLRRVELVAGGLSCETWSAERLRTRLPLLRACTLRPLLEGLEHARTLLAEAGVSLVWVEPMPRSRLSGAAFPSGERRVVGLTLRHGSDDHVWFTVFHELGHLLLHGARETFVDDGQAGSDVRESEADAFARDTLVPSDVWEALLGRPRFPERVVRDFAREVQVAPGIVVGFLQHDALVRRTELNELKQWCEWREGRAVVRAQR